MMDKIISVPAPDRSPRALAKSAIRYHFGNDSRQERQRRERDRTGHERQKTLGQWTQAKHKMKTWTKLSAGLSFSVRRDLLAPNFDSMHSDVFTADDTSHPIKSRVVPIFSSRSLSASRSPLATRLGFFIGSCALSAADLYLLLF